MTTSSAYAAKLKEIRIAEGLTQKQLSEISGISLGSIKNYESGHNEVGLTVIERIIAVPILKKYTLWLMTGDTHPGSGQISPTLSPDGQTSISSHQTGKKAG